MKERQRGRPEEVLWPATLRWEGERGSKIEEMRYDYGGEQYECTECRCSSPLSSRDIPHGPLCDLKPYRMTARRGSTMSKTRTTILAACVRTSRSNERIVLIKCLSIFRTCSVSSLSWSFSCSFVHAESLLGSPFEGSGGHYKQCLMKHGLAEGKEDQSLDSLAQVVPAMPSEAAPVVLVATHPEGIEPFGHSYVSASSFAEEKWQPLCGRSSPSPSFRVRASRS